MGGVFPVCLFLSTIINAQILNDLFYIVTKNLKYNKKIKIWLKTDKNSIFSKINGLVH